MKSSSRSRPSWRAPVARVVRPELWLVALAAVGIMLVEVAQSSRVAELALASSQIRAALEQEQAHLDHLRAELECRSTRAKMAPLADRLGLAPLDARQIVVLPADYLAADDAPQRDRTPVSLMAWAERASRALVPDATARARQGN